MKVFGQVFAVAIVVACCALLGYFLYLLVASSDQTRLAVLTALVSVSTLVYTQYVSSKREAQSRQFAKKAEIYEEIIFSITDLMQGDNEKVNDDDDDDDGVDPAFVERLKRITPKLMVWGGADVIAAWQKMATPTEEPLGALVAGNELIGALRRELGHQNDGRLGPLGLVSTMIKHDERPNRSTI